MSAQVIPFPLQRLAAAETDPNERLTAALDGLQAALAEQRKAVAGWRASLAELHATVQGVGQGLEHYNSSLEQLQADVFTLNGEAVRLEQWADSVLVGA